MTPARLWFAVVAATAIVVGGGCTFPIDHAMQQADRGQNLHELAEGLSDVQSNSGGITLARGVCIEDDGPAFGIFDPSAEAGRAVRKDAADITDTPYWEPLSSTRRVRKVLPIGPLSTRSAELLVFASRTGKAKLFVQVNGSVAVHDPAVSGPASQPDSPRWRVIPIDASVLKPGDNEVVLWSEGEEPLDPGWSLLIAPREHFARGSLARRVMPGRSFQSDDAGKTWQSNKLGRAGSVAGEYAVRICLDQFAVSGTWTSHVFDLAGGSDGEPIHQAMTFDRLDARISQDVPPACRIEWQYRLGTVRMSGGDGWEKWAATQPDSDGQFSVSGPVNRYVQLRATLVTEDPAVAPVIHAVGLTGQGRHAEPIPPGQIRIVEYNDHPIVRSAIDFTYESVLGSRLGMLDSKFGLAAATKGGRTQFQQAVSALSWLEQTTRKGVFIPNQSWIAADILATQAKGPMTPLPRNLVYCQALTMRGIPARIVFFEGGSRSAEAPEPLCCQLRAACEFWSSDYDKWVLVDAFEGRMFLDDRTNIPLNGRELGQRFDNRQARPAPQCPADLPANALGLRVLTAGGSLPPETPVPGWLARPMLLAPRNNFSSVDRPTPLNVEWSQPGWPDLVRLADWRPCDGYPSLNQAQMEVQYGKSCGELWVCFDTQTPMFDAFQVNIDQTGWKSMPGARSLRWLLAPGPNTLQVRVRNKTGAVGPASSISIHFLPQSGA